jgi:tRNA threonylcarbamoyladenosine biosynthesis protein TsaE
VIEIPLKKNITAEDETTLLALEFVQAVNPGDKIVLNGQLGSGKTFFVKRALESFGIRNVNSPTFAIVNEYNGRHKVYHFDFFRIRNVKELIDIGWHDYMNDENAITFIEWGNLFEEILPEKRYEISILLKDNSNREISIRKYE